MVDFHLTRMGLKFYEADVPHIARQLARIADALEAATPASQDAAERQRDALVKVLVDLFGWSDPTYAHAIMHVENAVNNLRATTATAC